MTKSKGVGRGKGGGRPRKTTPTVKAIETSVKKAAEVISVTVSKTSRAKALLEKAYDTLEWVMDNSPFPAPRVSAAKAVIEIARAEDAPKQVSGGKKEQAAEDAKSAGLGSEWGDDLSAPAAVN